MMIPMAFELQMLGWSTLLAMLAFLPGSMAKLQAYGVAGMMSNRAPEGLAPLTGWRGRAVRAHENLKENYAAFAVAVILLALTDQTGAQGTEAAAALFLVARLAHMGAYLAGWPLPRTTAWALGWGATLYILIVAL